MSYIKDRVETALSVLQDKKIRCTYGALADYVGAPAKGVSTFLTPRRPEASWVVNKKTQLPTGYEAYQLHPDLQANDIVIETSEELEELIKAG